MSDINLVHLTVREGMSSVFMAQVVKPMAAMQKHGWNPSLLVCAPVGEIFRPALRAQWRQRHDSVSELGLDIDRLPSPPSRYRTLWSEVPLLRLWLRRRFGRHPKVILHCRGRAAAQLALDARAMLPGLKVVFDCRGLTGEEYAYVRGYTGVDDAPESVGSEARAIEQAERRVAHGANHIVCVSNAMKEVICDRWGISRSKASVVPSCTDADVPTNAFANRAEVRRRLNVKDCLVVAYCGSLERWQVPESSLQWFKRIARIRSDAHLLAITTHPKRMTEFADASGISESIRTVLSVPQEDVASYLVAADCGLLIRESSPVNCVASPVKFAEYLAAGVPVVISEDVGDYSQAVHSLGLGLVVPNSFSKQHGMRALHAFLSDMSAARRRQLTQRCMRYAANYLDWSQAVTRLDSIYRSLQ